MPEDCLAYERLDGYQRSIEFLVLVAPVLEAPPRGHAGLADQLRRASISIPLNIAEAVGKVGDADRARFYAIARGSAMECGAILDVCRALRVVDVAFAKGGKAILVRVVAMRTKMCR